MSTRAARDPQAHRRLLSGTAGPSGWNRGAASGRFAKWDWPLALKQSPLDAGDPVIGHVPPRPRSLASALPLALHQPARQPAT